MNLNVFSQLLVVPIVSSGKEHTPVVSAVLGRMLLIHELWYRKNIRLTGWIEEERKGEPVAVFVYHYSMFHRVVLVICPYLLNQLSQK